MCQCLTLLQRQAQKTMDEVTLRQKSPFFKGCFEQRGRGLGVVKRREGGEEEEDLSGLGSH